MPSKQSSSSFNLHFLTTFHLAWILPILPKDSLTVLEESWNAYPYTKTRFSCPFLEKFSIEMETFYYNDAGNQENVFSLSAEERKNVKIGKHDIFFIFKLFS